MIISGNKHEFAISKYKNKKYDEVISYCNKRLKNNNDAELFYILGMAKYRKGVLDESVSYIVKAIELRPNNLKYYIELGDILRVKKEYKSALENYNKVLKIDPKNQDAYFKAAVTFKLMRLYSSAFKMGVEALSIDQNNVTYKLFLAKCMDEMKEFNEALKIYNEILRENSKCLQALFDKGDLLRRMFKYDGALECAQQAFELDKRNINYFLLMSTIMKDMKKIREGIEYLEQGLKIKPDSPQAQFNKSVMLLGLGEFDQGWDLYEWRWKLEELKEKINFTKKPFWNKQKNANLLLWPEQGVGDEIMFSSMFNEIKNDVTSLIVKTDHRLIPIFTRSFPHIKFISSKDIIDEDLFTHHLPMGSLPSFYRRNRSSFQNMNVSYLKTNDAISKEIDKYFEKDKYYIGISWRSINPISGLKRSATMQDIIRYIGKKEAVYVNLQYGDVSEEVRKTKEEMNVQIINIDEIDNMKNIDGLFSIIEKCDEIISIDNSTIHFSGSIGKKTEVLLHESADFRWELYGENANWYKSVKLTRNIIL